jgi:hypothetical protein
VRCGQHRIERSRLKRRFVIREKDEEIEGGGGAENGKK